jgi:hypothetical protein
LVALFGKDDKLTSAMSLTVEGGKELKVTYKVNLRLIPRALLLDESERTAPKTGK